MLLLHEVHQIAGAKEDEFDAAYRDEYLPALAGSEGSRLLWYNRRRTFAKIEAMLRGRAGRPLAERLDEVPDTLLAHSH